MATTTFNGFFFRPNLQSTGQVPATGPFTTSPDIICAGQTPIADYVNVLTNNYNSNPYASNVYIGTENYFYLRGMNGATSEVSDQFSLYYAPNAVINWPSQWINNVIQTETGANNIVCNNIAPNTPFVVPTTFLWNPPAVPSNSDHYCLFSYATSAANPVPIPGSTGMTYEDMGSLIQTNLNIGWKNTVPITNNPATWTYNTGLSIPSTVQGSQTVHVYVSCVGLMGGTVQFQGSNQQGASGPVALAQTKITQNNQILGTTVVLEPGFDCTITVSFWANGITPATGSGISLQASYDPGAQLTNSPKAVRDAVLRGLVQPQHLKMFEGSNITPTLPVYLGRVNYQYV